MPAGHISLNTEYETPESVEMIEGQYFISNFFILKTIQGAGLGRAAMDVIEARAIAEPLNAKTLALSTVDDEALGEGVIEALGMGRGISNMKWYGRRGYEAFKRVEGNVSVFPFRYFSVLGGFEMENYIEGVWIIWIPLLFWVSFD